MTSTEIAEKLSCIPEKDIELLTGMMLAAKSGDDRRLLIDMLDRVNEYAYLTENGIPLGDIAYRDFVMGNCPIDTPSPETVEQFRKTIDAAEAGEFQPVKVNLDVVFGRERHKIRYERVVDS